MHRAIVDIDTFLRGVEGEFDGRVPAALRPETRFRDLAEWTSLQALTVLAGFERDYGITIAADELARAETLHDVYLAVLQRLGPQGP